MSTSQHTINSVVDKVDRELYLLAILIMKTYDILEHHFLNLRLDLFYRISLCTFSLIYCQGFLKVSRNISDIPSLEVENCLSVEFKLIWDKKNFSCYQIHQYFRNNFWPISFCHKITNTNWNTKMLQTILSYENAAHKMLVRLAPCFLIAFRVYIRSEHGQSILTVVNISRYVATCNFYTYTLCGALLINKKCVLYLE